MILSIYSYCYYSYCYYTILTTLSVFRYISPYLNLNQTAI